MKTLLCIFLSLLSYFFLDQSLAIFLHTHKAPLLPFSLCSALCSPFPHLFFWICLTLISLYKKKESLFSLCLPSLFMITLLMFTTGVLKIVVGRARPDCYISTGFYGHVFFNGFLNDFRSFPSSHTAVAFGTLYLWRSLKNLPFYVFLLASLVAVSRILLNEHYLSDVFMGGLIGIASAEITLKARLATYSPLPPKRNN